MSLMPKIISAGFATCAIASATVPAFSWNEWSPSGMEFYVNREMSSLHASKAPAARTDAAPLRQSQVRQDPQHAFIWAPGRYVGSR